MLSLEDAQDWNLALLSSYQLFTYYPFLSESMNTILIQCFILAL